ncbi:MAG TPA: glycine cleavage system protein GcvH [Acholeplasmatales bacterium]|nr:glycine cleavage system protein GcvH [Acholeplasmatales bacterium]
MSKVLENLRYAKSHEWAKIEGKFAFIGITDYAQHSLGVIVYVDGGEVGRTVSQFEEFGAVESVKAASDLLSPLSGTIVEINQEVIDSPESVNADPYANWIIKIEMSNQKEIGNLLDAASYQKLAK